MKRLLALLLFPSMLIAQKPAEAGVILDNDLYTSPKNDQYYTNGIEVFYRYMGTPRSKKVAKKVTEFRIGQYIYNPQSAQAPEINVQDRPFAAYLFAEAGVNTFFKNESVLKANLQVGVVGPEAYGEEVQAGLHNLLGYDKVEGWQYQIRTLLGLQSDIFYSHKVLGSRFHENIDFHAQAQVQAGTVWMGASVGALSRIRLGGKFLPMYDSALQGAAMSRDKESYKGFQELLLFINPTVQYMRYDATILGSMFDEEHSSPVTYPLIHYRFNAEVGVLYRKNNWTYSYSFNYRGKELTNNVITGYYYGSIRVSRFL